jgi:aryl-phospho-beta-D-glucosidase BglC (GH1 family)
MSRARTLAPLAILACGPWLSVGCSAGPGETPPTPSPTPQFSRLGVNRQQIVDSRGTPVRLRGVNLGGWLVKEGYILHFPGPAYDAPSEIDDAIRDLAGRELGETLLAEYRERWIGEPDLAAIAGLGFNSVRLPLHHRLLWDMERGQPREEGLAFLDRVVGWCERQKLWVFLDLHCAAGGQNGGNISDSDGTARLFGNSANEQATIALWRALAARYAGSTAVGGYDLLNEPVWSSGAQVESLYRRIAAAIREVDAAHIIVLEGNSWASDFSLFSPPFDSRTVYSFHKYWNDTTQASISSYVGFSQRYAVPLWLGETGENSNAWYEATLRLMRDNDIGWCFWPWKKVWTDNCPLSVEPPAGTFEPVSEYLDGQRARPTAEQTAASLRAMLEAAAPERCKRNQSVIDLLRAY